MSLENLLKKILDDAQAEADGIIRDTKDKAESIKETAKKEASEKAESFIEEKKRHAELEASRIVTGARLEKKIKLLSCKKKIIDEVLVKAFKKQKFEKVILKRKIILKDGIKEELFDEEKIKEEVRPKLETYISRILEI
jgi:vacuolar-type H+-ATPase subunit E/Vma4